MARRLGWTEDQINNLHDFEKRTDFSEAEKAALRLAEVAERMDVPARLIDRASEIDWDWLGTPATLGLTAGASAPEVLVREVIDALHGRFAVTEEQADHTPERMIFKLPRELVA